ncbi:glycosyltransferase family 2 protein [Acinetobacter ursingii]|uniref:glycosyltransferase family 2 protein n=1 Tax=Acinetobacter ursingii TaxID=108980 RepID=UPI00300B35F9
MISIGIPFYNAELYLADSIKSVIYQSYGDWELILIDDGSSDSSLSIAREFEAKDTRIRVISDGFNKKLPYRLNQIIMESKYDYIARMDADDLMHPERLSKQLDFLIKNKEVDLVASSYFTLDSKNKIVDKRLILKKNMKIKNFILGNHFICHPTIMARKKWYLRNFYDLNYDRAEDFELWVRALSKKDFNISILPDILFFYREDGSISKEKLIKSYKKSALIFYKYRFYFGNIGFLRAFLRNSLKIFLVSNFYGDWLKNKLVEKRAYNAMNQVEMKKAIDILNMIENLKI